jgi:uncharacterized membrane protein YcaP (DUF421 family)
MFETIRQFVTGYHQEPSLTIILVRVFFVYIFGIGIVRINRHFMFLQTPHNFILSIFIGSVLAQALVSPRFFEMIGMILFIMIIDWLVAIIGYYWPMLEHVIEGKPILLIYKGTIQWKMLNQYFITENELRTACRLSTNQEDLTKVEKAYFESNGKISFILKE